MARVLTAGRSRTQTDEAVFHLAAGGALATVVYTACTAGRSPEIALQGAVLVMAGTLVSWWARRLGSSAMATVCLLAALAAAGYWTLCAQQYLSAVEEEPGLILALHMSIPLVAISFFLVRVEVVAFSLVPAVTIFGLTAGGGDEYAARLGFTIFLPLALLAVGYAMIFSGEALVAPHDRERLFTVRGFSPLGWRGRHWGALGTSIVAVMVVAHLIYVPIVRWADAHRWQIIMSMASPGTRSMGMPDFTRVPSAYPVGRGPVSLGAAPIFRITGEYADYWRGEIYDQYLGSAWSRSNLADARTEFGRPPNGEQLFLGDWPGLRGEAARHVVTVVAPQPLIFYAPGGPRAMAIQNALSQRPVLRLIMNGYGVVEAPGQYFQAGASYQMDSVPLTPRRPIEGSLAEAPPAYLEVPLEAERVADLAKEIVAGEHDPQRRLALLTNYLHSHCFYNTNAPAVPRGEDAVTYFVFTQKIGYCDLFASSLAIMARAVGIPTRFVTGYAFPEPDKSGGDSYVLQEKNAHAWVEAYLPSAGGWITVDPTPSQEGGPVGPSGWRYRLAQFAALWRSNPAVAIGLAIVCLLPLLFAVALLRGWVRIARPGPPTTEADAREMIVDAYLRLCRMLRRYGHRRRDADTPLEYLRALERAWEGDGSAGALAPARALTHTFLDARYGPGPVALEQAQVARTLLAEVRRALHPRRREQP